MEINNFYMNICGGESRPMKSYRGKNIFHHFLFFISGRLFHKANNIKNISNVS